nr:transposase [Burkholderia glumae]
MNEQHGGLQSRLVADRKRDGRRKYDEDAKRELIQACLKPGVSIARTAMEHDINPNLVRTWTAGWVGLTQPLAAFTRATTLTASAAWAATTGKRDCRPCW